MPTEFLTEVEAGCEPMNRDTSKVEEFDNLLKTKDESIDVFEQLTLVEDCDQDPFEQSRQF